VNFQRVDDDLLIAGVVVRDYPTSTDARRKALRAARGNLVSRSQIQAAINQAHQATDALESELRETKDQIIAHYRDTKEYQAEIAERLRPNIERALGQVHDYKQFVRQIIQNINVLLATRYGGSEIDEQLSKATHEEVAIYWAARLMEEKLDAALYVMYPDRINEFRDRRRFRFHGAVTKYRKIYQRRLEEKKLDLDLKGESRGIVEYNPRALTVIPHAMIDNAIKYAPQGTRIEISYDERADHIDFVVSSFGPLIYPEERETIFDLFVRGKDAERRDGEGTGFGLAAAQVIAKTLGTEIFVRQEPKAGPQDCRWTSFSVRVDLAPDRDSDSRRGRGGA
jgi:K+-sensing histidine kinase KdpD